MSKLLLAFCLMTTPLCAQLDEAKFVIHLHDRKDELIYDMTHCKAYFQKSIIYISSDFQKIYFELNLVPEEDSPFHYAVWGQERGTHIFEAPFVIPYKFLHSDDCRCKQSYSRD
jgi:hypothetical protein